MTARSSPSGRAASSSRGFVLRHTRLRPVPGINGIPLHLADEVLPLWHATQVQSGDSDGPLPYWAFAWGGGLAIARYLADHPEAVAGRRVLDLAAGSGLCAIAAMRAGAADALAVDIDPLSVAAIGLNGHANGVTIGAVQCDLLDDQPPDVDVILVGDTWYEASLADRVYAWLVRARDQGADILIGDPGRRYLPRQSLVELACYEVRTTTELEDLDRKEGRVYALAQRLPHEDGT